MYVYASGARGKRDESPASLEASVKLWTASLLIDDQMIMKRRQTGCLFTVSHMS